jgi:thiol-disulfide isomerase/thioredoxin
MTNRVTLLASSQLAKWLPNLESTLKVDTGTTATVSSNNSELAPDVQFVRLEGGTLRLAELRGRVVLLNFWATWCIPCRAEIPALSALQKDLEARGLSVVGVSYDDTPDLIREFQQEIEQNYSIVLGGKDVGAQLPASPLPTTYIIDREGRIRQKFIGEKSRAAFEAIIKPLLDESPATAKSN